MSSFSMQLTLPPHGSHAQINHRPISIKLSYLSFSSSSSSPSTFSIPTIKTKTKTKSLQHKWRPYEAVLIKVACYRVDSFPIDIGIALGNGSLGVGNKYVSLVPSYLGRHVFCNWKTSGKSEPVFLLHIERSGSLPTPHAFRFPSRLCFTFYAFGFGLCLLLSANVAEKYVPTKFDLFTDGRPTTCHVGKAHNHTKKKHY